MLDKYFKVIRIITCRQDKNKSIYFIANMLLQEKLASA